MIGQIDLATLIAQLPHLSKVITAEHVHPNLQKTLLFRSAQLAQLRRKEQVGEAEDPAAARKVREEEKEGGDSGSFASKRQKQNDASDLKQEESAPAPDDSPWSGNIINLKI